MRLAKLAVLGVALSLVLALVPGRFVRPVSAQSDVRIASMHIDIWPEYDRPGVLVIYRLTLSPDTALPAEVSLRMPRDANRPFNVAMQSLEGMYNLKYDTIIGGEWILVRFTTPSPDVQFEYYDPRLDQDDEMRYYTFEYACDHPVDDLTIQVQQPLYAEMIEFNQEMETGRRGQDGLIYYRKEIGEVKNGTAFSLGISFRKANDALSVYLQPVKAVATVTEGTKGKVSYAMVLPWAAGGFVLAMVIILGFWYMQAGGRWTLIPVFQWLRPKRNGGTARASLSTIYCHQCGKRANQGDNFCRICGAKLHQE